MSVLKSILGILAGYAIWTFSEYWIHRVVFHFEPEAGLGARMHWIIHGVHHDIAATRHCGGAGLGPVGQPREIVRRMVVHVIGFPFIEGLGPGQSKFRKRQLAVSPS